MAQYYSPKIVTSGLVLCLDAANSKSYPGSDTSWRDISGRGNHGTMISSPTWSSSNGGILTFNGSGQYVQVPSLTFTQSSSTNVYTVIAGARLSSTGAGRRSVFATDDGGHDWGFGSGDSTTFTMFTGNGVATGMAQDTRWHVFAAQWSPSGSKLYIDGVISINTADIGYDSSISGTSIGGSPNFSEWWIGDISFIHIYNRALSADEIQQNFYALRTRLGI